MGATVCGCCGVQGISFFWPPHTETKDLPEDRRSCLRPACFNVQLNVRYRLSKIVSVRSNKSQQVLFCDCHEKANDTELKRLPCHSGFYSDLPHSLDRRLCGCSLEWVLCQHYSWLMIRRNAEHSIYITRKASSVHRSVLYLDVTLLWKSPIIQDP